MYDNIEKMYLGDKTSPLHMGVEFWRNAWSERKQVVIIGEMRHRLNNDLVNYCVLPYSKWDSGTRSTMPHGYCVPAHAIEWGEVITLEAMLCHENPRLREYATHLVEQAEIKAKQKRSPKMT